jgi:hypothetical protein
MLGTRIERAAKGSGADWVDTGKTTYDLVGPVPAQYFNAQSFTSQVLGHLAKVDRPVLDLRGLGTAQIAEVDKFISGLAASDQRRLIIFR